jgi:hypothetical protein
MKKFRIIHTTDAQHLGLIIEDVFPLKFSDDGTWFVPDDAPLYLGYGMWRFSNSNYNLDVQEMQDEL